MNYKVHACYNNNKETNYITGIYVSVIQISMFENTPQLVYDFIGKDYIHPFFYVKFLEHFTFDANIFKDAQHFTKTRAIPQRYITSA